MKKILIYAVGPIGSSFLGFITVPLLSWLLSQDDMGRISIFHLLCSLATLAMTLGLDQYYMREYYTKKKIMFYCLIPSLIFVSILVIPIVLYSKQFNDIVFDINSGSITIAFVVLLSLFFTILNRYLCLIFRMKDLAFLFSLTQIIPKLFIFSLVLIYFSSIDFGTGDFIHIIFIYLFSNVILSIYSFIFCYQELKEMRYDLGNDFIFELKKGLIFGVPLIVSGLAFWGVTSIDKIMIKELASLNELAIYSVSVSFASFAVILRSVFSTIWMPIIYKNEENNEIEKMITDTLPLITMLVVMLFCLTGVFSPLLTILLPKEYSSVSSIVVCCIGYPLFYTLSESTSSGIYVKNKTKFAMLISLLVLIVNFLLNYYTIPTFGAKGAAFSTLISFYIYFILRTEASSRLWINIEMKKTYLEMLIILVACVYTMFNEDYINNSLLWISLLVFFMFKYKNEMSKLLFRFKAG
ncbi:polysaccharide biosynthesis C-terminal domain-containing protein [Vibrio parahaemolyticus]|nr:polysaccharide biosynthesis C-terminal domain-containing protein [Vibrio parahaemolyticus]EJG1698055.1 polysaccharide biosynthesis C-terminal domain-containing protein [Vibrio parahaemolyticus]